MLLQYVTKLCIRAFMDGVKEGRIHITANKLPSFIYDEAMYDGMQKVWGACEATISSRFSVISSQDHQAYFQLSSAMQWCKIIDKFDLIELYNRILTMFKDNDAGASWIKETIKHWKVETPGLLQWGRTWARTNEGGNSNEDSEDDMDIFFDSDEPAAPRGNRTRSLQQYTLRLYCDWQRYNFSESSGSVQSTNGHQDSRTHQNGSERARENHGANFQKRVAMFNPPMAIWMTAELSNTATKDLLNIRTHNPLANMHQKHQHVARQELQSAATVDFQYSSLHQHSTMFISHCPISDRLPGPLLTNIPRS
ncbi:hypothetical protein F4604DRAFT_1680344 [Suillus subluteus]|nr:hypothetical protein F4604DRAFT_1680344 [Suillus subluteus]